MKKSIPITLDILERNGFQILSSIVNKVRDLTTVSADTAIYKAEWGYMKIVNMGQQYGWNLTQIWYDKAVPTNSVMVESVSELQLALKVFKVNLKIKL